MPVGSLRLFKMIWQDLVITGANIVFVYALIPQVYQGFKEKKGFINFQTGLLTTLGMYTLAFVFFTLNLMLSTIMVAFAGTLWLSLLTQKIIYK